MKLKQRLAGVMACSLLFSQMQMTHLSASENPTYDTSKSAKASLEVTVNLDYPVLDIDEAGLKAELLQDGKVIDTLTLLSSTSGEGQAGYGAFKELSLGTYQVKLSGKGYKSYLSQPIELEKTEKHLVVDAGSETLAIGDVNGDGKVDDADFKLLEGALGTENAQYDLSGDHRIDIEDLSRMHWSSQTLGDARVYSTRMILDTVLDADNVAEGIVRENKALTVTGEIAGLFDGSEETMVSLKSEEQITDENPIRIPVAFNEEVAVSQITLTAPFDHAPTEGRIIYLDENNEPREVAFSSAETMSLARTKASAKVITINLGRQIPLQKLTIEVTGTSDKKGLLAAISKIEFLEDVADTSVNQEQGFIKGLTGRPDDEGAVLSWNKTANVTGYKVSYGTEKGVYSEKAYTSTPQIEIGGLKNFKEYYFAVQAVNGDWEGPLSQEIMVIPEPQNKPSAPQEVKASIFDQAVKVHFRMGDEAVTANAYYKKVTDKTYTKVADIKNNGFIRNLENDTEYMFYLTAQNSAGESKPSEVVYVTPKADIITPPVMPTLGRIDNSHITSIEMLDKDHINMKYYPNGFDPKSLIDNDFTTHWTASAQFWRDRGVRVTFDQSYEMDYVAVVPRLDRDLDRYEGTRKYHEYVSYYAIRVWETLDSEPKLLLGKTEIPVRQSDGLRLLPFEKTKVQKIEVYIYEWDGAGSSSLSEVAFYEYNDIVDQVDALFDDKLHTTLKEDVQLADIEEVEARLNGLVSQGAVLWVSEDILRDELQAAKEILQGGSMSMPGKIVEVDQTIQRATAQHQNFASGGLSDLQPTGTMAYAKDRLLVYVDAPEGGTLPELVVSQFYGDGNWNKAIALKPGRNIIDVPQLVSYQGKKGGPVYLKYAGNKQEATTVRIVNAASMPALLTSMKEDEKEVKAAIKAYVEELAEYVKQLPLAGKEKDPANATEIATDKVLLSLPAEEVYRGITDGLTGDIEAQTERLYESLMTWEADVTLLYDVLGLSEEAAEEKDRYPDSRFNIRYMPMNNGVFMYAGGDHIGIQYGSGAALVKGDRHAQAGYFGWGINHEMGHIINDKNYVIGEVTNNIFALFAQTINGGSSRLEASEVYDKIYEKVVSRNTGLSSNVFVNLGMFWQLHLAYDDANDQVSEDDFYPVLHRLSRQSDFGSIDSQNYFIRLACDAAKKDLTPFFERWGLHITEETRAYVAHYEKETRALYYLNDDAMRYRLNKGEAMKEDSRVKVEAAVQTSSASSDKVVRLDLSSDMDKDAFLGYEIYRDGELIAFTVESTYNDEIAANNVTHTYSVVGYDKLLNKTAPAYSEEVYIAAEGIVSRETYTIERTTAGALQTTGSALQIKFNNTPEVVGLKFKDVTDSKMGGFKVEVSTNGEDWQTAKESSLKMGTSLIYFNKPGTSEEDDRIWTYDAKYIRISGKEIESLKDDQIDVIEYPGDAVSFTEGAIGHLAEDYSFEGAELKKGTLVVMGAYRGHPVYNKIVLSAQYVDEKDFDAVERPGYSNETMVQAVEGELYMFAELPEDHQVSKVGNGIWLFVPSSQELPSQIKANMYRTDEADTIAGGRLVSDTKWQLVPAVGDMPQIKFN